MCPGSPYFSTSPRAYEGPPSPAGLISVWSGSIPPSESDAGCSREARVEMTVLASGYRGLRPNAAKVDPLLERPDLPFALGVEEGRHELVGVAPASTIILLSSTFM